MVAYLTKSDASEGFNQIINFLNGSYIQYALTVNPNIYVSCIKQFWNTIAIKQVNDVTRLQALVNKKKVVVTEAAIREVFRLDDAEGVDYLPNEEIFAELARMGYEKPSKKLTFYKAFFSSQWKFLIHTILQSMRGDAKEHVQDVTGNNDAQGDDTDAYGEVLTVSQEPSIPSPTPPTPPPQPPQDLPSTSQKHFDACAAFTRRVEYLENDKVAQALEITKLKRRGRIIDELDKNDAIVLMDDKEEDKKEEDAKVVEDDQEDEPAEVHDVVDVVTTAKLSTEVVTAASETVTAASTIISAAEPQVSVATITAAPVRVAAASTKKRKGVVIRDPKENSTTSSIMPADTKSKDKGKGIMIEEPKPLKKKQQIEMDEEYARKLHAELNKDID
nr:hypothetical protein [Tanacetum cinerariifolium]